MTRESSYTILQNKAWRAITYDWDVLSTYGNTSRMYCLTDFQVAWLLSNTQYLRWKTRWENCPCTEGDMNAIAAEMEYNLMTCIDIQPWMLEFNYGQAVEATLNSYDDAYTLGGIPELNPNTPTDFYNGDDSTERQNALCTACNIYVRSYAQNWLAKAQVVLGVTAIVAVALSISVVGGVIAGTLLAGLAFITQTAMDAMQDNDALDNVVCCMNTSLDGLVINQANFETALDNCLFTVGSNEAIIRDIIASDLDKFDNWLSFINSLGDAFVLAEIGVIDCPCEFPMDDFIITFDSLSGVGWVVSDFFPSPYVPLIAQDKQNNTRGLPVPSCKGAYAENTGNGSKGCYAGLRINLDTPQTVALVDLDFYWLRTVAANNTFSIIIVMFDSDDNQVYYNHAPSEGAVKNAWVNWGSGALNVANVSYIDVYVFRTDSVSNSTNSQVWVDNVVVNFV